MQYIPWDSLLVFWDNPDAQWDFFEAPILGIVLFANNEDRLLKINNETRTRKWEK